MKASYIISYKSYIKAYKYFRVYGWLFAIILVMLGYRLLAMQSRVYDRVLFVM